MFMNAVKFLQEKGWTRADIIIDSSKSPESYEKREIDYFRELGVKATELIKESDTEVTFQGHFIFIAPFVAPGEKTPALTKEDTEVKIIFRRR
jgi:hypothetical protein